MNGKSSNKYYNRANLTFIDSVQQNRKISTTRGGPAGLTQIITETHSYHASQK